MSRRPSKDQLTFSFTIDKAELMALEGGSQEVLSGFEMQLRQALKAVLDECGSRSDDRLDRFEVAARMSRLLGREITKSHIDQWTALSTIQRRMHVDALRAFCEVTEDWRPFHCFVESCGFKALHPDEAVWAEYGAIETIMKNMSAKRKVLQDRLDDPQLLDRLINRIMKEGDRS